MIDSFIFLSPILLLGVVALLGFVGCLSKPAPPIGIVTISPASGPSTGNTPVTITGMGEIFNDSVAVKFGSPPNESDVPATRVNDNVVTAVTPMHAAGPVAVEADYSVDGNDFKCVLADGSFFTYYDPIIPLQPPALSRVTAGSTNSASLPAATGRYLVIATVQWGAGGGATLNTPSAPGANFIQIGVTDMLTPQRVATFYAFADLGSGLTVTATLTGTTNTDFNLLVSAYGNADPTSAPVLPVSGSGSGIAPAPSLNLPTATLAPGDVIYVVAIARLMGGLLKGQWAPGAGATPQIGAGGYLLLETYLLAQSDIDAGQITVTATDQIGSATSRWYLFAMGIVHS